MNVSIIITDCLRYDSFRTMKLYKNADKVLHNVISPAPATHFAVPSILSGHLPFQATEYIGIFSNFYTYAPLLYALKEWKVIFLTANIVTSKYFGYKMPNDILYFDFENEYKKAYIRSRKTIEKTSNIISENIKMKIKKNPLLYKLSLLAYKAITLPIKLKQRKNDLNIRYNAKVRGTSVVEYINDLTRKQILRNNEGTFMFIHLIDTHAPYGAPNLLKNFSEKKLRYLENLMFRITFKSHAVKDFEYELVRELYYSEVEMTDRVLDDLINIILSIFGYDETLIIILSDHGEMLGENGVFTHPTKVLTKELLHVPVSLVGGMSKEINFQDGGVYSSAIIHDVVTNILLEKYPMEFSPSEVSLSFSYKSVSGGKQKVIDIGVVRLNNGTLKIDLLDQQTRTEVLQILRRQYLKAKARLKLTGLFNMNEIYNHVAHKLDF